MKIKKFYAKNVFNYLDLDVVFNDNITFLVGGNGNGKTTVLRLIHAILAPSLYELSTISFSILELTFSEKDVLQTLRVERVNEEIIISSSKIDEELVIPIFLEKDIEYRYKQNIDVEDYAKEYFIRNSDHKMIVYLSEIKQPIFLGLERKYINSVFVNEEQMYKYNNYKNRQINRKDNTYGSLIESLRETEFLIQNKFKRIRRIIDSYSEKLLDNILLTSFNYSESSQIFNNKLPSWDEKKYILERKEEIFSALSMLGKKGKTLKDGIKIFFDKLENLFDKAPKSHKKGEMSLEWIINKTQIDRIAELIDIIDDNNSKVVKIMQPISLYLNIINNFFVDSGKSINIDPVGHLFVVRPNKKQVSIDTLSSGERQLLIIFSHLLFNQKDKDEVFFIDEPELSLHMRWQEIFVENLIKASPTTQFIMATHSPEIVVNRKSKCISPNSKD